MFFRRAFAKNQNDYNSSKETFEEISPNREYIRAPSPPSPPQKHHWQMKSQCNNGGGGCNGATSTPHYNNHHRRGSFGEKEKQQLKTSAIHVGGGLSVLQLTPIWEHIIRTNSLPHSINIQELFEEFYARLHDPEISVRSHALRVLVDVLIVMGQQADYHVGNILHPLVDNLGHIAPAVRKSALDALRVYVAQSAMPETVMLDIMSNGMNRPANDPFSGRLTVAIMLALPALILPILITPKRAYVVKAVIDALSSKMVQITYQEIALKILLKIKDMVGLTEFHEYMPINVKKDFDLLCKVYGLPKTAPLTKDPSVDLHVPAYDPKKPWASKFVPKKDPQGNVPTSHAPIDSAKYFGGNYDATYPFERTRLSNNLGTPRKVKSPRQNSAGIMRAASEQNLSVEFNGNSSGSESGGSTMSLQTQTNTAANSKVVSLENGVNGGERTVVNGKVIMETEIKITPETAVTMRILEQNPSTQTDESEDENANSAAKKIITDFSAPYPVTPMKARNVDELKISDNSLPKSSSSGVGSVGRRVRFGGEIIKMRTPDSDTMDQSDDNDHRNGHAHHPHHHQQQRHLQKENSNLSDNSSVSSDNSTTNEYIKQANVGFINEPLSLNQMRSNIGHLKEKKAVVEPASFTFTDPPASQSFSRAPPMSARPVSSRPPVVHSPPSSRPNSSSRPPVVRTPPPTTPQATVTVVPASKTIKTHDSKAESSSSTDYSQELNIRIPEVETVLPAHFTPPNIMIKKNSPMHLNLLQHQRPATSPMMSPKIITIPATSSSSHSSRNNSPNKSAPVTPNYHSPSKSRQSSATPEKIRRSVSSLSPRSVHHGVTILHNLMRSPGGSPSRNRRASMSAEDIRARIASEGATQTIIFNPKLDEMTQTPNGSARTDEMTQTSIIGELKCGEGCEESTPSSKDSPGITVTYQVQQQQQQPEFKSWEELGIVDYYVLKDLKSGDFRLRSKAICAIEDALKSSDNLAAVQPYLDSLLRTLLTSERHPDVAEDQRRVLSNLISRLPLENLEDRVTQIVTGLCRQGGAGSNLVAKHLMQRLPTAAIVLKLLSDEFLQARSSKFRENALQMVIFALVTFPSTYFDISNCVERTTKAALDRKKRVRQAALDVLAVLGQISSPRTVINVVSRVADSRVDGLPLLAAVKARLARKQLPLVTVDGDVTYALRIPSASNVGTSIMFGSDVEWICSGSGSVSPTSLKSRSTLKAQSSGVDASSLASTMPRGAFEERRLADGLNRYAVGGANASSSKASPWSRIPVRGATNGSSSDDDHSYIAGTAYQGIQRPLESSGRFHGKLHSRSFPELSDNVKEKQPPVRQMSDNSHSMVSVKLGQNNKLPVASTKLPTVETSSRGNANKNPYSFGPNVRVKRQQHTSDGVVVYTETIGSPSNERSHLESRPRTHPPHAVNQTSSLSTSPKHKLKRSEVAVHESPRKSSAKANGNELTIQPLTLTIGLVESDDTASEQNVIKTQPSAKSRKSEDVHNEDMVENYVVEQVRRTSGKTNSHILSDVENSLNSTPRHQPNPKESTSTEFASVRNEIAQIQSAIESVKREMVEMQKQKSANNTPSHVVVTTSSRPPSSNSNKTFVYEQDLIDSAADVSEPIEIMEEIIESPQKSRPPTAKSILKNESPFKRIATPAPDDVINDEHSLNSPYEPNVEIHIENETEQEETEEVSETVHDETDHTSNLIDPMLMIRSDSTMTISREHNIEYDEEEEVTESSYQEAPPEILIKVQQTPTKANRPPVLKRNQRTTPVRNPMPNINQTPTVVIRAPKVSTLFPPSLRRFERPKDAIQTCIHQLESSNWEEVMEGLKNFVRLIRHHPEYVEVQVHLLTIALARQVKNLRSQVSRAACSVSGEFFLTHARALDGDAEELAAALLNRTADTNKFLRADATKALESMCDTMHPSKSIMILAFRGAAHQNAAVRCTTAKLLNQLVFRIGCDKVFNLHREIRDRLILTGANLLMEGSLETRNHTKEMFKQLSIHSHYQKILLDVIPSNVYRNIEKALKSIR